MTAIPRSHIDLVDPTGIGALATLNEDGPPQVTAVTCFMDHDSRLKISVKSSRHKVGNLRARPYCTLLVIDREDWRRTIEIRASAELVPDDDYAIVTRLYEGLGKPDTDMRAVDGPGVTRLAVVLEPLKVNVTS